LKGESGWKAKKLKEKGKTYNQVERKQNKETNKKSFKDINRERQCTNQPKAEKALERQRED
jgi:hypothetical protein